MPVEGHGRTLGLRSVQSRVWAQLLCRDHGGQGSAPRADGQGRVELLDAHAPRFLRRPEPHVRINLRCPRKSSTLQSGPLISDGL